MQNHIDNLDKLIAFCKEKKIYTLIEDMQNKMDLRIWVEEEKAEELDAFVKTIKLNRIPRIIPWSSVEMLNHKDVKENIVHFEELKGKRKSKTVYRFVRKA